jgi:hypothetical protein
MGVGEGEAIQPSMYQYWDFWINIKIKMRIEGNIRDIKTKN